MSTWSVVITSIICVIITEMAISLANKAACKMRQADLKERSLTVGVFAYKEPTYYEAIQVGDPPNNSLRLFLWAKKWGISLVPIPSSQKDVFRFNAIKHGDSVAKMLEYQVGDWFIYDDGAIKVIKKADFAKNWRME